MYAYHCILYINIYMYQLKEKQAQISEKNKNNSSKKSLSGRLLSSLPVIASVLA